MKHLETVRNVPVDKSSAFNAQVDLCVHPVLAVDVKKMFFRLRQGSRATADDIDLGGEPADDSDMNLVTFSDDATSVDGVQYIVEVRLSEVVARFTSLSSAGSPPRSMSSSLA